MHDFSWGSFAVWGISLASILLMLVRPRGIAEFIWISTGAVLLVATGLLPFRDALGAIGQGVDVYLFLTGMMLLAELARYEGVFDWLADLAVRHSRGSAGRLFLLIYLAGTIVTVLLSNDATAVVLTPAVLAAVRKARVEPRPYLLTCAFVANAASFVLPISNPANLVVYGRHLPSLLPWLRIFLLPSLAAIASTYCCLRLLEGEDLRASFTEKGSAMALSPGGKITLFATVVAAAVLLIASALGWQLGAPTCVVGAVALLVVMLRDHKALRPIARGISWSVLPLVAGLFMIVAALNRAGMLALIRQGLERLAPAPDGLARFLAGGSVAGLSNVMNNLPVGLASGAALQQVHVPEKLAHAVLIGVDLGPNLSVTGSLATILWLIALRREEVEITGATFLKLGLVVMPVSLILSVILLI